MASAINLLKLYNHDNVDGEEKNEEPLRSRGDSTPPPPPPVERDATLDGFLPDPTKSKYPDESQEKINKILEYKKRRAINFNSELRKRKAYRNPLFLENVLIYQDIDPIGSCFDKDVFDPHGFHEKDYYHEEDDDDDKAIVRRTNHGHEKSLISVMSSRRR